MEQKWHIDNIVSMKSMNGTAFRTFPIPKETYSDFMFLSFFLSVVLAVSGSGVNAFKWINQNIDKDCVWRVLFI